MILPEGELSKQSLLLSESDRSSPRSPSVSSPLGSSLLVPQAPPGYEETNRPNTQITYTFFPQTIPPSSMIMKPPAYIKNPHPSYYISVNMNCFTPSSYITTIRRDGWEGDVVGDFEMGISAFRKPNTVCFRGYERPLNEMLESCSVVRHICGNVILKKIRWIYTGKSHHLLEHRLYRVSLGKKKWLQTWLRNSSQEVFWHADQTAINRI